MSIIKLSSHVNVQGVILDEEDCDYPLRLQLELPASITSTPRNVTLSSQGMLHADEIKYLF